MTRSELVSAVHERLDSDWMSKRAVKDVVDCLFVALQEALSAGESVRVEKFGCFNVQNRAARAGRNPRTGDKIEIPASRAVKFSPAVALKRALNP